MQSGRHEMLSTFSRDRRDRDLSVAEVFDDWRAITRGALIEEGRDDRSAEDQAELCIAALEGALMLARIERSPASLDRIERQVATLLG